MPPEEPCLHALASWASLRELSLCHLVGPEEEAGRATAPGQEPELLLLDLPASLPPRLEKLALKGVRVGLSDLVVIAHRLGHSLMH